MNIFDSERLLIENRIKEIKDKKANRNSEMEASHVIVGGEPVLEEDATEMAALCSMKDILNNNMKQPERTKYLDLREQTNLPELELADRAKLESRDYQISEERKIVQDRIGEVLKTANISSEDHKNVIASDGKIVRNDVLEEYESLLKMEEIIKDDFKADTYEQYSNLRAKTKIVKPLSEEQYEVFMGVSKKDFEDKKKRDESELPKPTPEEKYAQEGFGKNAHGWYFNPYTDEYDENYNPNNDPNYGGVSVEDRKSIAMQNYKNAGYGQNTLGWYYDPSREEYVEGYDPTKDPLFAGNGLGKPETLTQGKGGSDENKKDEPEKPETPTQGKGGSDENKKDEPEEPEKLSKWKKAGKWVSKHKKQILIAVGLTALTIAVVVAITQLAPALLAASQAENVAGLAAQMVNNGSLWHAASATEKAALHAANTALASQISAIGGASNAFNAASGVWTLGTQALPAFAESTLQAASAAKTAAAALMHGTALTAALGGLTAVTGVVLPKKKSAAYKTIRNDINNFADTLENSDMELNTLVANKIADKINSSSELSDNEKKALLNKLQRALSKAKKKVEPNKKDAQKKPEQPKPQDPAEGLPKPGGTSKDGQNPPTPIDGEPTFEDLEEALSEPVKSM